MSLNAASGQTVTVDYATANDSATAGFDYQAAAGTLTFAAGQTTKTVTVLVNGDSLDENDENYFLNLSNALNASIARRARTRDDHRRRFAAFGGDRRRDRDRGGHGHGHR